MLTVGLMFNRKQIKTHYTCPLKVTINDYTQSFDNGPVHSISIQPNPSKTSKLDRESNPTQPVDGPGPRPTLKQSENIISLVELLAAPLEE